MRLTYEIATNYAFLKQEILDVVSLFEHSNEVVFEERNVIKKVIAGGLTLNVKRFKRPHLINKLVYGKFRKSKAYRSYHTGLQLIEREINTPPPVAYLEFYKGLFLDYSYYISIHVDYDYTFRNFLEGETPPHSEELLVQFAQFSIAVQQGGVWNKDHSPGNTLIVIRPEQHALFYLVDLNRIELRTVTIEEGMLNFNKLWATDAILTIIGRVYAETYHLDVNDTIKVMIDKNEEWKARINRKKKLKSKLKRTKDIRNRG